jgi:hypothetical protein
MHPQMDGGQTNPQPGTGPAHDDLARLKLEHPGWNFGTVWTTVNSGPDKRRIWASRDGVILSGWTAAELAQDLNRESARPGGQEDTSS